MADSIQLGSESEFLKLRLSRNILVYLNALFVDGGVFSLWPDRLNLVDIHLDVLVDWVSEKWFCWQSLKSSFPVCPVLLALSTRHLFLSNSMNLLLFSCSSFRCSSLWLRCLFETLQCFNTTVRDVDHFKNTSCSWIHEEEAELCEWSSGSNSTRGMVAVGTSYWCSGCSNRFEQTFKYLNPLVSFHIMWFTCLFRSLDRYRWKWHCFGYVTSKFWTFTHRSSCYRCCASSKRCQVHIDHGYLACLRSCVCPHHQGEHKHNSVHKVHQRLSRYSDWSRY